MPDFAVAGLEDELRIGTLILGLMLTSIGMTLTALFWKTELSNPTSLTEQKAEHHHG